MQITIEVPDSITKEAAKLGVPVTVYTEKLLDLAREELRRERARLREREAEAFVRELSKFSDQMPSLPESAFTRESIYADHD